MYQITDQQQTDTELQLTVAVAHKAWDGAIAKREATALKRVSLPGFRKGKVPLAKARAHINHLEVAQQAINDLLPELYEKVQRDHVVDDNDAVINLAPEVELKGIEPTPAFLFRFDLVPSVKLPDYKKIPGLITPTKPTAQDVQREIKALIKNDATMTTKDGKAALGDVCVIDFSGSREGKEVPGATGKDYELELGSGAFIPGFEDGLIGLKAGDQKELALKFPEQYHAPDLAGKDITFKVTVKSVKTAQYPALTPEYIGTIKARLGNPSEVVDEKSLAAFVLKKLTEQHTQQTRITNTNTMRTWLITNAEIQFMPKRLLAEHVRRLREQFTQQVERLKISLADALKIQGITEADFEANINKEAENNVRYALVADHIAEVEKIDCTDQDVDNKIAEFVSETPRAATDSAFKAQLAANLREKADYLRELIINEKLLDLLTQYNTPPK